MSQIAFFCSGFFIGAICGGYLIYRECVRAAAEYFVKNAGSYVSKTGRYEPKGY